ncbi:hypothetical protein GCM10027256_33360 [Novispirillum itersonii subsp. nipponicum]
MAEIPDDVEDEDDAEDVAVIEEMADILTRSDKDIATVMCRFCGLLRCNAGLSGGKNSDFF